MVQEITWANQLPRLLMGIALICALILMCFYDSKNSISENNYYPPIDGLKYRHQFYNSLLTKWLENNTSFEYYNSSVLEEAALVDIVRNVFVEDQMYPNGAYGFDVEKQNITGQLGAPILVDRILSEKRNGFFIESGGVDGLHLSNSLFFELKRNYTGALIEPSSSYKKLRLTNRKVKSLNVCLS